MRRLGVAIPERRPLRDRATNWTSIASTSVSTSLGAFHSFYPRCPSRRLEPHSAEASHQARLKAGESVVGSAAADRTRAENRRSWTPRVGAVIGVSSGGSRRRVRLWAGGLL